MVTVTLIVFGLFYAYVSTSKVVDEEYIVLREENLDNKKTLKSFRKRNKQLIRRLKACNAKRHNDTRRPKKLLTFGNENVLTPPFINDIMPVYPYAADPDFTQTFPTYT